jgi:drug/metabolite transporter (DMT)-like permease
LAASALALLSALLYGAADFLGGLASRTASTVAVVAVSQFAGLVVVTLLLPVVPATPAPRDFAWGAAAGLSGGVGVALLYRALAIGTMGIVAPTTAVCAVVIPVAAGVLLGERPPARTALGIVLALVAIVLVSQPAGRPSGGTAGLPRRALPPGIGLALLAGVAIGMFYLALAQTAGVAGLWPLVAARLVSVALFGMLAATAAAGRAALPRGTVAITVAAGILDMLANACYLLAVRQGPLAVVVTLASLYPASTVALARVALGERVSSLQTAGIVAALAAVALIVS